MEVKCKVCNKVQTVSKHRAKKYHTCSVECLAKYNSKRYRKRIEHTCLVCGKVIFIKPSHKGRTKTCGIECKKIYYRGLYLGSNNPNYRGKTKDYNGYLLSNQLNGNKRIKVHSEVVLSFLKLTSIPKGFHIHHRDCNKLNNEEDNLVLLSISDHMWIHRNFGIAVLNALQNKKITLKKLCSWSRDPQKAEKLLSISILDQIGVFKSGELLGTPEADNQQPSVEKA